MGTQIINLIGKSVVGNTVKVFGSKYAKHFAQKVVLVATTSMVGKYCCELGSWLGKKTVDKLNKKEDDRRADRNEVTP